MNSEAKPTEMQLRVWAQKPGQRKGNVEKGMEGGRRMSRWRKGEKKIHSFEKTPAETINKSFPNRWKMGRILTI